MQQAACGNAVDIGETVIRQRQRRLIECLDAAHDGTVEQRAQTLLCGLAPAQEIELLLEGLRACTIHNFYVHGQLRAIFISESIGRSDLGGHHGP